MTPLIIRVTIVGASRVIRMEIIGDATTWSINLMTLESSFTIVMCVIIQATVENV
jgi:hypothetical protein